MAGTTDSSIASTADAASNISTTAKDSSHGQLQSPRPLTTDDITTIVSSIVGTQASKPTPVSSNVMDSSSKDLG